MSTLVMTMAQRNAYMNELRRENVETLLAGVSLTRSCVVRSRS